MHQWIAKGMLVVALAGVGPALPGCEREEEGPIEEPAEQQEQELQRYDQEGEQPQNRYQQEQE